MAAGAILFDLDGTLVQTRDASWEIFRKTNQKFGLGIDTQQQFFALMQGNLFAQLAEHCKDAEKAEKAGRHFLELLASDYHPNLVPGIADVVKRFAAVHPLAVISSNSVAAIRRILVANDLAHCFTHVFGGDVEPDKRAAIRRLTSDASYSVGRSCEPAYREADQPGSLQPTDLILVTDTVGDVRHARECGARAIGVVWGMHSEDELRAAGAEFVAIWPQEIVAYLLRDAGQRCEACAGTRSTGSCSTGSCGGAGCQCERETPEEMAAEIRRLRNASRPARLPDMLPEARIEPSRIAPSKFADPLLLPSLRRLSKASPAPPAS